MRFDKRRLIGAAALAVVLTTAAACSSSGKSTNTGGGGSSGSTGSGGTSGGAAANGSPITIGGVFPIASSVLSEPDRRGGFTAAIDDLNAHGGIDGHPLKLDFCDTQFAANQEIACMRKMVSDKVTAVLNPNIIQDQSGKGYLFTSDAKIPVIGGEGLTPVEFKTAGVFPIGSGIPGWATGQVAQVIKAGAKKIAIFGDNSPGAQFILSFAQSALKSAGITPVRAVQVDPTADPTFAQGAAKVIEGGVDAVIYDSAPNYVPKAVAALRQAGYTGIVSTISGVLNPALITAMGAQANGLLVSSQLALPTDTSNSAVQQFNADMKQYAPGVTVDETGESAWAAVMLFDAVAKNISGGVTSQSVMAAFNDLSTPINISIIGPYQVKGVTPPLKDYPNIYNPTITEGKVENGQVVPDGAPGFVNPFTAVHEG
jgi:branched-chain amino acid transport system substrate-binding protein